MTTDRALTLIAVIWILLVILYLAAAGVIHVEAGPIPGGKDDVVCGVWTYYGKGKAERAMEIHGIPECADCVGIGITVDQSLKGRKIEIRHKGEWVGPFLVGDVGSPGHHRPRLVGEVDYRTAMTWRIVGPWWTCYRRYDDG